MITRTTWVLACALFGCGNAVTVPGSVATVGASSGAVAMGGSAATATISATTDATSTSAGLATATCEELTTMCFGDERDALSGCAECAVFGTAADAVNGGACKPAYAACFGTEGDCRGGQPACCAYTACLKGCDKNHDGFIDKNELSCVCTTDASGEVCTSKQVDPNTCLGAFEANDVAYRVYEDFKRCVAGATGVCSHICYGQ